MNKISKKIVSLITMAAFVLTLVPAAAFAADTSNYTLTDATYNEVTVDINLTDADKAAAANVIVWAEDTDGILDSDEVTYTSDATDPNHENGWEGAYVATPDVENVTLTFANPGTYKVYVTVNKTDAPVQSIAEAKGAALEANGLSYTRANNPDRSKSAYGVMDEKNQVQKTASVDMNADLTTTFAINDIKGEKTDAPLTDVVVFAIDSRTDSTTSYLVVDGKQVGSDYMFHLDEVTNGMELNVQFTYPGEYTLYAADKTGRLLGSTKVSVNDTTAVDSMKIEASWIDYKNNTAQKEVELKAPAFTLDEAAKTYTLDLTQVDGFNFNGIDKVVLKGEAFNEDGSHALNQDINFTANEPNTVVKLNPTSDNTSNTGTFQTTFTLESQKNTVITVTDAKTGVSYDVNVIAQKTSATDIDSVKDGGYVLATTDKNWTAKVNENFGSAVQFMVTDEKGDAVEGLTTEDFVLDVQTYPKKTSTLKASNLEVVELGDGLYTLGVKAEDVEKDNKLLAEGKYEVRVALAGADSENDNIGVTFTAAEFGKTQDVELNVTANGVELDDQITLNTKADVSLVYVDGNGVKIAAPDKFSWNATNSALAIKEVKDNYFTMKPDTIEHQGVVGSTVLVQAAVDGYGLVEKELTIVSSYNTYSLELDPAEGPVNEYNKVDLNVLNSDGDVAKTVNGTVKVVVADSSNEDAKVSVKQAAKVEKGEGALTVYASQETELELVVTVVDDNNKIVAADTLTYTVGAADPLAGRTVVMTIDSTEYVVNNNIIKGDAAPYVDSNWRTMVPIRALAEAFDAEVYWNQDDSTVTINFDAGTEIVMTVGEETYTVNGAEATMDTEPVNAGDRVYVPIRFAAEGLGFSVTPLYNDAGLTASVVFQR